MLHAQKQLLGDIVTDCVMGHQACVLNKHTRTRMGSR